MQLILINNTYKYECEKVARLYYPTEKITFSENTTATEENFIICSLAESGDCLIFECRAKIDGAEENYSLNAKKSDAPDDAAKEKYMAKAMLPVLNALTGITPPWGILTGVRPSKLMRKKREQLGDDRALEYFTDFLLVSPDKAKLALDVVKAEQDAINLSTPLSCSFYISIPFCPGRCSYCSFVSHSIETAGKLMAPYIDKLCREIEAKTAEIKANGQKIETLYIGGGTPTALTAPLLQKLCNTVIECFDTSSLREFTVEAGRPDTIDSEKLYILKNAGVTRISINPQSFDDTVLLEIGRRHTVADIYDKFSLARSMGFDNINTDLIAGLPGDTLDGFCDSVIKAIELNPENITVHTLALKRSARVVTAGETAAICRETAEMLTFANSSLRRAGYIPYYMYRQSKSIGNLENVGWCKPGKECLYNIYMMEEIHSVPAAGAGAVSKILSPDGSIERVYNYKYPYEYIDRDK